MKLLHFLTENKNEDYKSIVAKIKTCSQILKEYDLSNGVFFRGMLKYKPEFQEKKSHIEGTGRTPTHTAPIIHAFLNKKFVEKFGWPARNGVFVSATMADAVFYGAPFVIFPFNDYKFVYSPKVGDLYGHTNNYWVKNGEISQEGLDKLNSILETYTDMGLHFALSKFHGSSTSGIEVMFNTKKYYALSVATPSFADIMQELGLLYPAKKIWEYLDNHDSAIRKAGYQKLEWNLDDVEFAKRIKDK